jgi:hypothetical protein
MKVLLSIDDTDAMKVEGVEVRGTGELADMIRQIVEERGWGICEPITRHQLLVHPDIPYTSHNSAMCFIADIAADCLEDLIAFSSDFLVKESAAEADPGLCVAVVDRLSHPGWLISFGYMAKNYVLTKQEAYDLAETMGIHLSEHGGTGQGVIGALAGAGLRLSGNDGRFRGKLKINSETGTVTAGLIKATGKVDVVKSLTEGIVLTDDEEFILGDTVKPVLLDGKAVLPVFLVGRDDQGRPRWQTYSKSQMKEF